MKDISSAFEKKGTKTGLRHSSTIQVCWHSPMDMWIKLNTDGAAKGNLGPASCGGLIRYALGRWLVSFTKKIDFYTTYMTEIWGIYTSLSLT